MLPLNSKDCLPLNFSPGKKHIFEIRGTEKITFYTVLVWLQPATKTPRGHPSPRQGAEENGKKQAETGGSG